MAVATTTRFAQFTKVIAKNVHHSQAVFAGRRFCMEKTICLITTADPGRETEAENGQKVPVLLLEGHEPSCTVKIICFMSCVS